VVAGQSTPGLFCFGDPLAGCDAALLLLGFEKKN
jgi:hypothetical protein